MHRSALRSRLVPLALVGALAAAALAGHATTASGTPAQTLRFQELEKGSTYVHIRNTKASGRSNPLGDQFAFAMPLATGGKTAGTIRVACTTTVGAKNFERSTLTCNAVITLAEGTLTAQLDTSPSARTTTGAITGGTGRYANARGVFVSEHGASGATDTITLVG